MASTKVPIELSSTPGIVDNSNATAITIDSSENVQIGSNSFAAPRLQLYAAATGESQIFFGNDGTNGFKDGAIRYFHESHATTSDRRNMTFSTANTERMRIDSSGNVGIGTTTPTGNGNLNVHAHSTSTITSLKLSNSTSGSGANDGFDLISNANIAYVWNRENDSMIFGTNNTERMRIASNGNVLVGTTYSGLGGAFVAYGSGSGADQISMTAWNGGGSGAKFMEFVNSGGSGIGSISQTASNTTQYNTTSDARLKDVTGSARGLEVINALNPVAFNWKEDGHADEGLLAQEVLEIVPNAVSGSEEKYYQMDYSKLVTHLIAGMKEQQVLIEQLQAEVALLKGE